MGKRVATKVGKVCGLHSLPTPSPEQDKHPLSVIRWWCGGAALGGEGDPLAGFSVLSQMRRTAGRWGNGYTGLGGSAPTTLHLSLTFKKRERKKSIHANLMAQPSCQILKPLSPVG